LVVKLKYESSPCPFFYFLIANGPIGHFITTLLFLYLAFKFFLLYFI
jgi:hypothetical protein